MGIQDRLKSWVSAFFIERPAKKLTLTELAARLEEAGQQLAQRIAQASEAPANRKRLRHVIGIERWGQSRLRVALGESLVLDEYDDYRPAPDLDWQALRAEFQATRQDTIALARQLEEANAGAVRVPHNDLGELSVRGWLYYLNMHARLESRRIKTEA